MRANDEGGQIMVVTAVALVLMLVCVGLVVDVGHAMLVQRQLQAGADAAALAAVQHLPDGTMAENVAVQYSASPGSRNSVNTVSNARTDAEAVCLDEVPPSCDPPSRRYGAFNGIKVRSQSDVPTWFGRIIGINSMQVNAEATACAPCSEKPLDIMLVLDRTGSMCAPISCSGNNMSDLRRAKDGAKVFLSLLDPTNDRVGLALLPPVLDSSWRSNCGNPAGVGYRPWDGTPNPNVPSSNPAASFPGRTWAYGAYWPRYVPDPLLSDASWYTVASLEGARTDVDANGNDNLQNYYVVNVNGAWRINDGAPGSGTNGNSALVQRLNCAGGAGTTHYAFALEEAQYELVDNGRANRDNVIVFLSDGAANTMPQNVNTGHWSSNGCATFANCPNAWKWRPCGAGVESANRIKQAGTTIYTIGYDLDGTTGTPERCQRPNSSGFHNNGPVEQGCGTPSTGGWGDPGPGGCNAEAALRAIASSPSQFYLRSDPGDLTQIFTQIALDIAGSRGRLLDNVSPDLVP